MTLLQKLDFLMQRDGLNKHTLSEKSGVPYTTITGMYVRGTEKLQLSTLQRLCDFFHVSLDYLAFDKYEKPDDFVPNGHTTNQKDLSSSSSDDEQVKKIIELFASLPAQKQQEAIRYIRYLADSPDTE